MLRHELLIQKDEDGSFYKSYASSQTHAVEMLEKMFIPVYQDEKAREYMLIPTIDIERVFVKVLASEEKD